MKETKVHNRNVNHYRQYLKILVLMRSCLQIMGLAAGIIMITASATSLLFWVGFQVFCFAVAILLPLLPLISAVKSNLHSAEALQATREYCDAADAFDEWRTEHWLGDGGNPEAQELIRRRDETRAQFFSAHSTIKENESLV